MPPSNHLSYRRFHLPRGLLVRLLQLLQRRLQASPILAQLPKQEIDLMRCRVLYLLQLGQCLGGAGFRCLHGLRLLGGDLTVNYTDDAVYMTGNAVKVFDGTVEI